MQISTVLNKLQLFIVAYIIPYLALDSVLDTYLRSLDQENDCADIGISAPSAKLIQDGNCFLSLRPFGEIYKKPKHCLYKKTLLTLTKLICPFIIPIDIKITLNYKEKPTL